MAILCGKERLEYAGEIGRINPTSVVFDFNADVCARCQVRCPILRRLGYFEVSGLDAELPSPLIHGFDGVLDDFHEGLLHFCFVEADAVELVLELE